jgi:hypothetical protein
MFLQLSRSVSWWAIAAAVAAAVVGHTEDAGVTSGVLLEVAGRSNATPTMAAVDRFVAVTWGATAPGGQTDVYAAVSRDGARGFAMPVRVNDVPGDASLGGEQPPQVALVPRAGRDPEVLVLWTAKAKDGTRLLTARSTDGGASFGNAAVVGASVAQGNRGWESLAVDRDGHAVAVWLDHRELAAPSGAMSHEGHDHGASSLPSPPAGDGVARAQLSTLYFARVDDPASARSVTGGVCYCCKTAVAAGPDGSIYAVWRHVYPGNLRDIAFTASRDGGRTFAPPVRVSEDAWALDGCPENGPTMAVGDRGAVHVVWPTLLAGAGPEAEPALALFHAATLDGHRFSARQRLPTQGTPRHPRMAMRADGSLIVAWDEALERGRRQVAVASAVGSGSTLQFRTLPTDDEARGEYPVVAVVRDGAVVAWTRGEVGHSAIRVARIP